ncbi:aldo/keto reductase [Micromonospora sp. NBC_01796]|uniref:aldo/keto reductase n=1 Tax=Micromonospora sp. NBC_01796 TaxID=2975987 RepID=UPI002DDAE1D4|nr:aldo/keto reductase [Micromonospora sp. NBC_01796]WSA83917.1 aldo/keto reductase [Micromonospora sp. NBC_01796]
MLKHPEWRGQVQKRALGSQGLQVSALGYGAMVLVHGMYGASQEEDALATLLHVLDRGVDFIDTADAYGTDGGNERLVGRAVAGRRDEVAIATKWGIAGARSATTSQVTAAYANTVLVDARPELARPALEASLRRLGVDMVDLWYLHFPDPAVPIAETVGAMAALVRDGLVRHIGVCNVTAEHLRAAHAEHPISAVQSEWSLWTRDVEAEVVPAANELGIGVVPWGPLGNGFLAGSADSIGGADLDFRNNAPRFQEENLRRNVDRFAPLRQFAAERGISQAQLALAWLLRQGENVVPIPGSRRVAHVDDNLGALDVLLTKEDLDELGQLAHQGLAAGPSMLGVQAEAPTII